MSTLHAHLSRLHAEGHRQPVSDLLSDARFASNKQVTHAAVLVAVTDSAQPGVLLTQRPTTMRDHPGQVAFPGGKLNPGEDAISAALREAEEELALPRNQVQVIGTTDRYHSGSGFDITPVLGVVPSGLPLEADSREVVSWFEAPLSLLMDHSQWREKEVLWQGTKRRYLELYYNGYRIWGVTAAIIANLSRRINWPQ